MTAFLFEIINFNKSISSKIFLKNIFNVLHVIFNFLEMFSRNRARFLFLRRNRIKKFLYIKSEFYIFYFNIKKYFNFFSKLPFQT